ncbi:DNA-directed RNA polymerase III subunit RPC4-like [Physella acuta]|uniref:DNA-directed RNA polymerase III subunit RPC4-like n=1 Tax=Physella acuta TaxID=109671 RepID=UPI0027DAFB55|nr:DNA-directed RNA polymerase III subunit RPC4-like [Physella acuta]XP_059147472.1 DNA-directed RNA polymerase III subunit RPC4-like [Physella acuta]
MADDNIPNSSDIPRGLINRTGTPIGRGSRLPSVRGHRDLTLGGVQRKVFAPNLAAVKKSISKEDGPKPNIGSLLTPQEKQESGRGKGRGRGDRGRGRGRGRGQGEDRTIQLQSEFSYGPMGGSSSSSGWSRGRDGGGGGGGGGGSGGGGRAEADSTAIKTAIRRTKGSEEDKKLFDTLMKDDFISDLAIGDPNMAPIRLPLNMNSGWGKDAIKSEVKEEHMDTDETDTVEDVKPNIHGIRFSNNQSMSAPSSVMDILKVSVKAEKGELLFIQFPDTLPGLPDTILEADRAKTSTSTTSMEDELAKRLNSCQLKDCTEGYMGKLRIRKSGKAELILGENVMEVLPGIPINFHQELVSIRTDQNPGQMVVLGPVRHKLVVTPDYNDLLSHVNRFL